MPQNPSMSDEQWRWFQLYCKADTLSLSEIESVEEQLRANTADMDLRVQLFAYYWKKVLRNSQHESAEHRLFEHVLWMIDNRPEVRNFGGPLSSTANHLTPKRFTIARQAWLEQVRKHPANGDIIGNAGAFIVWVDFETGAELTERAYALQPSAGWLRGHVHHCNFQIWTSPHLYKNKWREKVINVGVRSLQTEPNGAPFYTYQYVADAALSLGRYDLVKVCAQVLHDWDYPSTKQQAKVYTSLLALREGDRRPALETLSEVKQFHLCPDLVFRVASELFKLGERKSIVEFINNLKGRTRKSSRERWLQQIANNQAPDFN
ncbi:MAG: hypothetical protein P4L53_24665 [Candidatus Obscuribacterales bacterium]|nr:hypothetical protein [Candidatus Obscuribacterales bacterium]